MMLIIHQKKHNYFQEMFLLFYVLGEVRLFVRFCIFFNTVESYCCVSQSDKFLTFMSNCLYFFVRQKSFTKRDKWNLIAYLYKTPKSKKFDIFRLSCCSFIASLIDLSKGGVSSFQPLTLKNYTAAAAALLFKFIQKGQLWISKLHDSFWINKKIQCTHDRLITLNLLYIAAA